MAKITQKYFGKLKNGNEALLFKIENKSGAYVEITNFGGAVKSICVPDKSGNLVDVCVGYDTFKAYERQNKYIGCLVGRHANRIGKGKFTLNGKSYTLATNNGGNNLHGGKQGFNCKLWGAKITEKGLLLSYTSIDGEEGFPAELKTEVLYTFDDNNTLGIEYKAVADADTLCNLTNHCYFNLNGQGNGRIENHLLQIPASHFLVNDNKGLPKGYIAKVEGTPMDFRDFHAIGERINENYEQLIFGCGYDHCYCPDGEGFRHMATAKSPVTGIVMHTYSDLPGIQLYTGNFLNGAKPWGKGGIPITVRTGVCFETQYYPDSINKPNFEKSILRKGEVYQSKTEYRFEVE